MQLKSIDSTENERFIELMTSCQDELFQRISKQIQDSDLSNEVLLQTNMELWTDGSNLLNKQNFNAYAYLIARQKIADLVGREPLKS